MGFGLERLAQSVKLANKPKPTATPIRRNKMTDLDIMLSYIDDRAADRLSLTGSMYRQDADYASGVDTTSNVIDDDGSAPLPSRS